jgi:hypothetical protein
MIIVGRGFSRDSLASRKLGFSPCAALVLNSTRIYEMTAGLHSAYSVDSSVIFPFYGHKKSPARNTGRIKPHSFSRRVPAAAAWEGVLTYGVSPITVAGPWPILTAFPASQTC